MSKAPPSPEDSEESSEQGLFDRVTDEIGIDIERLRAEIEGESEEGMKQQSKGPVVHPTDEAVLDVAVEALIEDKQLEKEEQMDDPPRDYREIPVELDIDDPETVVNKFEEVLKKESEDIIGYLYDNSLFDVTGPSLVEEEDELFTYIVEERNDDPRPAVIIGGAEPLRLNLSSRMGLTEDESTLVRYAHVAAARKNGYDRHILLNEVIILPAEGIQEN